MDVSIVKKIPQNSIEAYLKKCRWFGGKSRTVEKWEFDLIIPCYKEENESAWLCVITVNYENNSSEKYFLPLIGTKENLDSGALIYSFEELHIYDAIFSNEFRKFIFNSIKGESNTVSGILGDSQKKYFQDVSYEHSSIFNAEQSNSSFLVNDHFFFKVFRKISKEENTDYEILKYLTLDTNFRKIPLYYGGLKLHSEKVYDNGIDSFSKKDSFLVVMVLQKIKNTGNAWEIFYNSSKDFLSLLLNDVSNPISSPEILDKTKKILSNSFGIEFYNKVDKLAIATAEMHKALFSNPKNIIEFKSEFLEENRKLFEEDLEKLVASRLDSLKNHTNKLSETEVIISKRLFDNKNKIISMMNNIIRNAYSVNCIRIHGDYHLGQLLWTGTDFIILDFEGEPDKPHIYRRSKFPCLKDIAGIIRSFHYSIYAALFDMDKETPGIKNVLDSYAKHWFEIVSESFLNRYFLELKDTELLGNENQVKQLLDFFLFEKAIYELGYEINNRPNWIAIPLKGINDILEQHFSN